MADEDKTEEATPKKRQDERKKGNIFQSRDITVAVFIFVSFFALKLLFPYMRQGVEDNMVYFLRLGQSLNTLGVREARWILGDVIQRLLLLTMPLLCISIVINVVITMMQTKMLVSFEGLKFKLSKINPLKGLKRMISMRSLVELSKSLMKIIIMAALIWMSIRQTVSRMPAAFDMSIGSVCSFFGSQILSLVWKIGIVFAVIAVIDLLYQRWDYEKKIKMSKHEVKQEYKQMEGDPLIKSKRREMQQRMAMQRMMQQVPDADVVIRNPTHFAVALKYDEDSNAPVVLAKGADYIALKILEIAMEKDIPEVENPPLARSIYQTVEVGQEILPEHYQAVAEVFAWVYRLNKRN